MFNKDGYIGNSDVVVTASFKKQYEIYRTKRYHTLNTCELDNLIEGKSLDNDINDIFEGEICDDFLLTDYLNKN